MVMSNPDAADADRAEMIVARIIFLLGSLVAMIDVVIL